MECLRNNFQGGVVLDGRFVTLSPLNHGSFGMVFRARDLQTKQLVAVKCLTKRSAGNEAGVDFAVDDKSEELYSHRVLGSHPNVVNLVHSFETDVHVFLVLEYCSRGDLYEAIRTGYGPLETEHVRQFMLELVDAVSYMHSKGIYHRDIKPENIFLTDSGAVKLGDFGLATTDEWSYESTVGSDRYMAPEQYDSAGAGYSPAQADIWAVGVCLLNVLFSRNPFTTPTESDPLFLDFSRDQQSLFDVFPTMSQDTFEVITQCMSLDPKKRSLERVGAALEHVVSFTTLEEEEDDFCCGERQTVATSNREPLRTPSIQSPQVESGAFPWAKALHAHPPHPVRQLSVIPDTESYCEDLFPKSEGAPDWMSSTHTPSISSILTSNVGSFNSFKLSRPIDVPSCVGRKLSPMAGSLPINLKLKSDFGATSMVAAQKSDVVSKSWSEMWEEDAGDTEDIDDQFQGLKIEQSACTPKSLERVARSPSRHGQSVASETPTSDDDEKAEPSPVCGVFSIDEDLVEDGFFEEPAPAQQSVGEAAARYSPPSKRKGMDKWTALGERRRAIHGVSEESDRLVEAPMDGTTSRRSFGGTKLAAGVAGHGLWDLTNQDGHKASRDRVVLRECPWSEGRDCQRRREKRHDFSNEWVGLWQEAH